jgi:DNA-binding XRE family transcriptional regulator
MLTIEQIRKKLEYMHIMRVSKAIGIHSNTLYSIASGKTNPSYDVLKKISEFFERY